VLLLPRKSLATLTAILLTAVSCSKQDPPPPTITVAPSDHVAPTPVGTTQAVLEKTFNLKGSAMFPFEIPAHAVQPHLHGIFESFVGQVHGTSDESANIDFMIMNEAQQADLAADRASEALFSVESSHDQAVNFDLPASMSKPVKYYLVFRNGEKSKSSKVVEANFRVDF
jgi:hypothetical protein